MGIKFLRLPDVIARRGISKSAIYREIECGLFTRPVRVGSRATAWPENEVESINAARLRGAPEDTIRLIVDKLHELREEIGTEAA